MSLSIFIESAMLSNGILCLSNSHFKCRGVDGLPRHLQLKGVDRLHSAR